MNPQLTHIDHVHVYVRSWERAKRWYARILSLYPDKALEPWAVNAGPLTLRNKDGNIHLALFEKDDAPGGSAIAFGTDGSTFLRWIDFLKAEEVTLRIADHSLAFSMYFGDSDQNWHEITTYDHDLVRRKLAA